MTLNLEISSCRAKFQCARFARRRLRPRGEEETCVGAQTCTNAETKPIFGETHVRAPCHVAAKAIKGKEVSSTAHRQVRKRGRGRPVRCCCVHGRQPRVCSGAHQSRRCRRRAQSARAARRSGRHGRARPCTRAACVLHGPRLPSLTRCAGRRFCGLAGERWRWWQGGPAEVITPPPFRDTRDEAREIDCGRGGGGKHAAGLCRPVRRCGRVAGTRAGPTPPSASVQEEGLRGRGRSASHRRLVDGRRRPGCGGQRGCCCASGGRCWEAVHQDRHLHVQRGRVQDHDDGAHRVGACRRAIQQAGAHSGCRFPVQCHRLLHARASGLAG